MTKEYRALAESLLRLLRESIADNKRLRAELAQIREGVVK